MILTQLPDLPPRPETPRNAEFRRRFYSCWGRENCIVSGAARRAEYDTFRQMLSIKTVANGREHYFVDGRRLTVTDETYLVLNEEREYGSLLEAPQEVHSFCIFFRPGMAREVSGESRLSLSRALDAEGEPARAPVEFAENLRRHDKTVSPVLNFIRRHVALGVDDAGWYEEQFNFLLARLMRNEQDTQRLLEHIDCIGAAKRRELMKRIGWATDFMHSNLQRDLSLADIAMAARLSHFHFLRVFRQVHGVTPMNYLRQQRTERALALLRSTKLEVNEIAGQVGLSRLALWRNMRDAMGEGPQQLRREFRKCHTPELV
ncbi:MAG: AraC family transcriptional regulator [Steroidobacter sp.]